MPTDFFMPISNAVARLRPNNAAARRDIYDRARQLLVEEAQSGHPPMPVSELIKEQRALEQAIQMVETQATFAENTKLRARDAREDAAADRERQRHDERRRLDAQRADESRAGQQPRPREPRAPEPQNREVRAAPRNEPHRPPADSRRPQRPRRRPAAPRRRGTPDKRAIAIVAAAALGVFVLAAAGGYVAFFGLPWKRAEVQTKAQTPPPPPAPSAAEIKQKIDALLTQASQNLESGNSQGAIEALNQAIILSPADASAFTMRGHAYLQAGDLDKSIEDFSEAIRLGSRDFYAFVGRGVAYRRKRDFARALTDYDEAIRIRADHPGPWNNRCFVNAITGNLDAALSDCNEALRLAPNELNALDSRALVYLKLKQYDKAIADYEVVLKRAPGTPSALYGRGLARTKKGDKRGQADIATATAALPQIAQEFERYGVK